MISNRLNKSLNNLSIILQVNNNSKLKSLHGPNYNPLLIINLKSSNLESYKCLNLSTFILIIVLLELKCGKNQIYSPFSYNKKVKQPTVLKSHKHQSLLSELRHLMPHNLLKYQAVIKFDQA